MTDLTFHAAAPATPYLGLPDVGNAFNFRSEVPDRPVPKLTQKTRPKVDQSARAKTLRALKDNTNSPFNPPIPTPSDGDRTARIKGRALT